MESLSKYRARIKEIADYAFVRGVDSIGIEQFINGKTDQWKETDYDKFLAACNDGFKIAQKLLIEEIKKYQALLRELNDNLKKYRRLRDKEKEKDIQDKTNIIKQRLSTFSHIADGIAWQLIGGQIHIARRFHIGQSSSKYLDSSNIRHAIEVADKINENPNDFALISDLTSFVQIGDLLVRHEKGIGVMELKEGKVNDEINDFFKTINETGKVAGKTEIEEKFNSTTIKQIKRMHRQQERAIRAIEVIKNDTGIDPVSGGNIDVLTPEVNTEYYHKELYELYEELKGKTWSYIVIDNCLHIGMYRDESMIMAGFAIKHILKTQTDNYTIIDWLSITQAVSEPIFAKPFPLEFIIDILTGKIKIIIGINADALIETWNANGLKTRWMTIKETSKRKQTAIRKGMVEINKKGIMVKTKKSEATIIAGGTFSKILYDNIKPANIATTWMSSD